MRRGAGLRSQWLAEISDKIDMAQRLAWDLRTQELVSAEARELYGRLEAARLELEAIRDASSWWVEACNDDGWLAGLKRALPPFDRAD